MHSFCKRSKKIKQFLFAFAGTPPFWHCCQLCFRSHALLPGVFCGFRSFDLCFLELLFPAVILAGSFGGRGSPYLVKILIGPLDHMEEIDAAGCIGKVGSCAGIDPLGAIPGNDLDLLPLVRGEGFAEETEDLQPVAFMDPYHPIAIHVIYDCDVGEPLSIAGFIYTDAAEVMHPYGYVGFNAVMGCLNTVSDCPPVNVFEQGNSRSGHPAYHPGDLIAEVLSETTLTICPGNVFRPYTVFGTFDPLGLIENMNRNAIEIRSAPRGLCAVLCIVPRAFFSTDWAELPSPLIRSGMNVDPGLFKSLTKSMDCNRCSFTAGDMHTIMVEIEDSF